MQLRQYACSVLGGYIYRPHFIRAAQIVLRAFREGQLGKFNLDIDTLCTEKKDKVHQHDAVSGLT